MKKRVLKIFLILFSIVFVALQFIPVNLKNPLEIAQNDFTVHENVAPELAGLIKNACYDCHSNQTKYPWYAHVAPVSFVLEDHIKEGRGELNFSEWTTYSLKKKLHKLEECAEMVENKEMPLRGYVFLHGEAKLSDQQRILLADFFTDLKNR